MFIGIRTSKGFAIQFMVMLVLSPLVLIPLIYVGLLLLLLIFLPGVSDDAILDGNLERIVTIVATSLGVGALIANALLLRLVWQRCSSRALSFFEGLETVAGRNMSGCANITQIYLFPVLTILYFRATFHTLAGLKREKKYTEWKWQELVRESAQ